jgi:hypothetical protein
MRIFKLAILTLGVLPVASAIVHGVILTRSAPLDSHSSIGLMRALVIACVYAAAAYGIHRRMPIVWNIGWAAIAFLFLYVLWTALPLSLRIPPKDHPFIFCVAVLIADAVVALGWGWWWWRNRPYFFRHSQSAS